MVVEMLLNHGVIKMAKAGRKKEYLNAAERQRAYRMRQKYKETSEIRFICSSALKKSIERLAGYHSCTKSELLEKLIVSAEESTLRTIARNDGDLKEYMI